jgi:hypothetical protein
MSFFPPPDKILNKDYMEGYSHAWKECRKEQWTIFLLVLATIINISVAVNIIF